MAIIAEYPAEYGPLSSEVVLWDDGDIEIKLNNTLRGRRHFWADTDNENRRLCLIIHDIDSARELARLIAAACREYRRQTKRAARS